MARSDVAYAALLMDDHDRGIRTLGQSLIDSRTSADLVAILGAGVTKVTETRMRAQGWRIRRLAAGGVDGDGGGVHKLDSASESVLAHASVWALTDYKRVVLLSDNMLVVENIDDLFLCEGICAAMQQAEVVSTSLIVLEPDLDIYQHMSRSVGTIYNFSNNFQGFLNTYLAGFETCAFFDLENPCLQDPSTDPNRGPDAPLLDHSCHRLPTRYNGDLALVMLNGGLGMVRTKNAMPEEWWRQRRARVVRFEFAGLRPWMWFASPFLPFVSTWESTHLRAKPGDPTPSVFWVVLVWLAFVAAFLFGGRAVLVPVVSGRITKGEAPSKCVGGWRAWVPRALAWKRKRRGSSASSYNPRGLLWSLVHLAVGYSSLLCAVAVGVVQVPAASTVKMSWIVFITWTGTLFGTLWSAYLWFISRQPQLSPRAFMIGNGPLDLASINTNLCPVPGGGGGGSSTDPFKPKLTGGGSAAGSVLKVGGVVTPSPWRESVTSLTLLVAVLAFLPAWKPMSGAASLPTLLVPAAVALVAMFVGLTVQMVRLPVLWCDRLKFLALMEKEGLRPCGSCGRVDY
ncbi:Glycosyltransferase, family GT8 [Ectocarpus siliculosus]|uniref:Glycosyltransferase, family GT8 n=1 Tax=Ectocarpus siliculosus TaxID=2880 RepID=D7FP94_ECTSI|nr:Glycosyltransferase, family GT8 [Ectocarpus siliculosus]|eukprot:CBJ30355.1 Glycosyltransferase, family GT8 [Ectocarpus siliculosus]